jgi:hypothetical protein
MDGFVVVLLDEVPAAAVLPKADTPKGDDCGVVVATGVCPNENVNAPDPGAGVSFAVVVVVVAAGVLIVVFTGNENLGVVVVLLPVIALGAMVVVLPPNGDEPVPVPKVNLGADIVAGLGIVEVEVETEAGVVGVLKLNVEVPLVVFCWSEPKAPVSDEEEAEGRVVVEVVTGGGFGVADLLGTLKVNFRGAFVDEVVADGLGCADGVMERLVLIEVLGLGTEKVPKIDGCRVGSAGERLDVSDTGAGA